ncbi:MAG: hypothetical protein IPH57_01185 [Saprospiraceae bacterium]|nr:hypothetical protein [Saprospiraceae bacterium]
MNKNWLNLLIKNLSFIVFIAFLCVLYITNVHLAERKMIKIEKMEKEVETLRYKYMDVKQSLLYTSAPSIIEKKVLDKGLKQTTKAPQVLKNEKN